jgi:proton glutamate symport protein
MKRLAAHWQILSALALATLVAVVFRMLESGGAQSGFVASVLNVSSFLGELFMRALKMMIVPLIVTSVVSGISSLQEVKGFGRLGAKTAAVYLSTGLAAILTGLLLVNLIQPGLEDGKPNPVIRQAFERTAADADRAVIGKVAEAGGRKAGDFLEVFRSMLPENILKAATDNSQLLGVIIFSILLAAAITRLPSERMKTVQDFFGAMHDAMSIIIGWVMALAPFGVFALILPVVYSTGAELFVNLGKYFLTVLLGLGTHLFVTLPVILKFIFGVSPLAHLKAMRPALLLAFSSASSSASLPVSMRCVEENSGVSKRVTGFTLPLGSTVNTDGTALYECVAVMFVAQVMGVDLSFVGQFFVVTAALLTSIGVAGIPSASLVAILLILKSSGIPGAETAVVALLAVDRLLDMSRTAVNVFGDSCVAVIVAKTEGENLKV